MLKLNKRGMYKFMSRIRGRRLLRKTFAFLVAFCLLCGAGALTNAIRTKAAGEYQIHITPNDATMGGFGYGGDCSGTIYSDYNAQADNQGSKPFPNNGTVITACPASGYYFSHWLVNGVQPAQNPTQAQLYNWNIGNYDSNKEINIEAVFVSAITVTANVENGAGGTIQMGWITPSGYAAVPINGTATNTITFTTPTGNSVTTDTITAIPDNGYRFVGVTTSGANVVYNDQGSSGNSHTFTLTISGDGTATVVFAPITYTTTINAGAGTATVASGQNYTVHNNGTSMVTVEATNTNVTIPVTVTPPSGMIIDSVSVSGVNYQNLSGNNFELTTWGDGGVATVNYIQAYTATVDAGNGTAAVSGNNITITDNNTGLVSISATGNKSATVAVTPPNGYIVNTSNPVSTTGNVQYNNDFSNNQFTLNLNGAGTATVNYVSGSPYVTEFDVSPSAGGTLKEGWGCNGTTISNLPYTSTDTNPDVIYPNNSSAITACPESGYAFVGWRISGDNITTFDITSGNNIASFNQWTGDSNVYDRMFANDTHNVTVTALFEASHTVTVTVNDSSMGHIKMASGSNYTANPNNQDTNTITLTYSTSSGSVTTNSLIAEANNGYVFDHFVSSTGATSWSQPDASKDEYPLTLTGDDTVTAVFVQKPSYTVTFLSNNPSVGQISMASGSNYTANPNDTLGSGVELTTVAGTGTTNTANLKNSVASGYFLDHFESSTGATTATGQYGHTEREHEVTISGNDTVTVYFAAYSDVVYTVSVNFPEAGSIDVNGGDCQDPSKKTNQAFTKNLKDIGNNFGQSRLDIGDNISVIRQCVDNPNYVFDHWEIDNLSFDGTTWPSLDPVGNWPKTGTYHTLRAVFSPKINYLNGIVLNQGTNITPVEPGTSNAKYVDMGENPTGVSYDTNSLPGGVKFAGWEEVVNNCNPGECKIVSTDSTFIPSGEQIYAGATYRAVFVQDNSYTEVTVAEPGEGVISYWSDSQSQYVDVSDNGEFHVATVNGYVDGPIKATPSQGYVFDHWEYNGQRINNGATINDGELQYQAGQNGQLAQLVAYFRTGVTYHVFTGYTGGDGYYDHNLPETRRGNNQGAQAGDVVETYIADADSDIMAATAVFSGEQHPTAPNGYYFAYWTEGCNTNYNFVEQVDDGHGILIDYNTLQGEKVVSLDTYFRPTRDQVNQCDEYIAVFYRKNQLRLIAQSENESIGVVNATTTSSSQFYQEFCDNTLMRQKSNVGVGVNANGFYSSCNATVVISNPVYELDYWTINGDIVTFDSSGNIVRDYTFRDPSSDNYTGFTLHGDQLNYLVAHYKLKILPHTGSGAIWFILGGGIGLIAIPSVILIVSERKEQKKGGKK